MNPAPLATPTREYAVTSTSTQRELKRAITAAKYLRAELRRVSGFGPQVPDPADYTVAVGEISRLTQELSATRAEVSRLKAALARAKDRQANRPRPPAPADALVAQLRAEIADLKDQLREIQNTGGLLAPPKQSRRRPNGAARDEVAAVQAVVAAFRSGGCLRCGAADPAVLVAHHRDPATKSFAVASAKNHTVEEVLDELQKCDCLCHNCHHQHHAEARRTRKRATEAPAHDQG